MKKIAAMMAVAGTLFVGAGVSNASIYYEKSSADGNTNLSVNTNYSSTQDGTGASPANPLLSTDQFSLNGYAGGTGSGTFTFAGGPIDLAGGILNLRNGGTKNFTTVTGTGTSLIASNSGGAPGTVFNVSTFNASAGSLTYFEDTQGSGVNTLSAQNFTAGILTGSGNIAFDNSSGVNPGGRKTFLLTVTTGTDFTGNIEIGHHGALGVTVSGAPNSSATYAAETTANTPSLQFGNNFVLDGTLIINSTGADAGRITLDHDVTFAGVIIDGTSLANGLYSESYLLSTYATIFGNSTGGSITVGVPEPSAAAIVIMMAIQALSARRRKGQS